MSGRLSLHHLSFLLRCLPAVAVLLVVVVVSSIGVFLIVAGPRFLVKKAPKNFNC